MPIRKTAEVNAAAPAETNPKAKRASATKSAVAVHKHKSKKTTEQTIAASPVPEVYVPTRDEISLLAYSYWESRGYQGGSPEEDWLRAEHELLVLAKNR